MRCRLCRGEKFIGSQPVERDIFRPRVRGGKARDLGVISDGDRRRARKRSKHGCVQPLRHNERRSAHERDELPRRQTPRGEHGGTAALCGKTAAKRVIRRRKRQKYG